MHIPYQDDKTLAAVEQYMSEHKWDEYVNIGDFMDFDCLSVFNKEMLRNLEMRRINLDYILANKILDRHQAIIRKKNKNAKFTLLEGNHEYRVETLVDKDPRFEGLIEVEKNLNLKERGFTWIRSWSEGKLYKIGKMYFSHGLYCNQYHAKKMCDNFGVSIYYGHTHDIMSIPKYNRAKEKVLEGHSMGCLCMDQSYMRGRPSNWQQGFGVAYVYPNGYYNFYMIRIFNGKFISPEGVCYPK